jgi:hypothetical protein
LRRTFWKELGLDRDSKSLEFIKFVAKEGPVPCEMVTPELFTGMTNAHALQVLEYLVRIQCLEIHGDEIVAEPVVRKLVLDQ